MLLALARVAQAAPSDSYVGLFETTATVSAAFFVACLIVAQITVDRTERARFSRTQPASGDPNAGTPDVKPPTTYHAELLFAALVVAMLQFNAMIASLAGLLPHHTEDADSRLTFALLQLGVCAYLAPLFVFVDARTRMDGLANLTKAVRVHDLSGILYGLTAALMFVALAGGISVATGFAWTDFAWEKSAGHFERLAWTSAFLIVSGGIAMALAMVIYFLTRPFGVADPRESARGTPDLALRVRYAVLSVAALLWITALSLVIGAIVTFSLAFYLAQKWVIVAVAVAAIVRRLAHETTAPRPAR
jgi:hypothetical protein